MGIFFNKNNKKQENIQVETSSHAFSGYRYEMPKDSPVVINYNNRGTNFVSFGNDGYTHNYPSLIQQSFYENSTHARCINIVCDLAYSGGWQFDEYDELNVLSKKDLKSFEKANNLSNMIKDMIYYYRLHNRINIKVTKSNNGKLSFKVIDPACIAYNFDKSIFTYSIDFINGSQKKEFKVYNEGCAPGEYMIEYDGRADKYYPYPAPKWISAIKSINIGAAIPDFHIANLDNSVNPSLVVKKLTGKETIEERNQFVNQLRKGKGKEKTGHIIYLTYKNPENEPKIEQLQPNKNDELFKELRESSISDICIAHGINEIIIGIQTPGSLGSGREMELHYNLMKLSIVDEIIGHINYVVNDLMLMCNLPANFTLNTSKDILPAEKETAFKINTK